jgi:hypothetical protein
MEINWVAAGLTFLIMLALVVVAAKIAGYMIARDWFYHKRKFVESLQPEETDTDGTTSTSESTSPGTSQAGSSGTSSRKSRRATSQV